MTEDDEQYQKATKAVDDAMRTDILGPKVCQVLNEHLPTNELLEQKFVKLIKDSSKVKEALGTEISNSQSVRLSRWLERGAIAIGAAGLYWLGQLILSKLS